jgi:hypothetical protein
MPGPRGGPTAKQAGQTKLVKQNWSKACHKAGKKAGQKAVRQRTVKPFISS